MRLFGHVMRQEEEVGRKTLEMVPPPEGEEKKDRSRDGWTVSTESPRQESHRNDHDRSNWLAQNSGPINYGCRYGSHRSHMGLPAGRRSPRGDTRGPLVVFEAADVPSVAD